VFGGGERVTVGKRSGEDLGELVASSAGGLALRRRTRRGRKALTRLRSRGANSNPITKTTKSSSGITSSIDSAKIPASARHRLRAGEECDSRDHQSQPGGPGPNRARPESEREMCSRGNFRAPHAARVSNPHAIEQHDSGTRTMWCESRLSAGVVDAFFAENSRQARPTQQGL